VELACSQAARVAEDFVKTGLLVGGPKHLAELLDAVDVAVVADPGLRQKSRSDPFTSASNSSSER